MLQDILNLKDRIFRRINNEEIVFSNQQNTIFENVFTLEEILEELTRQDKERRGFIFNLEEESKNIIAPNLLNKTAFIVEESKIEDKKIFLYEFFPNTYYIYGRNKSKDEENKFIKQEKDNENNSYGLFVPTGVIVRSVPQNVLGTGVLGRAFIHSNYIEILDSLLGNDYLEVLTHEVLHILYPEKRELEIRQITRNYIGQTRYN